MPRPTDDDDDDDRAANFTAALENFAAVARSAVEAESVTKRAEIAARAEGHKAALAANDAIDVREHARAMEQMKLDHRLHLVRTVVLSVVIIAAIGGLGAIAAKGYVREVIEVLAAIVLSAMSYVAGKAQGQLKGRPEAADHEGRAPSD